MVVERIQSNFITQRANQHVLRLQEGQVVEGKIIKLFANQHAEIKIGSTSLVAQIETSLSVGKSYYFQVQDVDGDIYLKVLHELKKQSSELNLEALMRQLQVKGTSQHHAFIQQLIDNGIPFQRQQLHDAIQLLQASPNQEVAKNVIQTMLQQKLPLNQSVFQALIAYETEDFSPLLEKVYTEIKQTSTTNNRGTESILMKQLEAIIQRPVSQEVQVSQFMQNGIKENRHVFTLSQLLGFIDIAAERAHTMQQLQQFTQSPSAQHYPLASMETTEQLQQMFQQSKQQMDHLIINEAAIRKVAMKIMSIFHPLQTNALQAKDVPTLQQMVKTELDPLLPTEVRRHIHTMLSNLTGNNQSTLYQYIQALVDNAGYDVLRNMSTTLQHAPRQEIEQLPVQQQFLTHLSNVLQTVGLNMEHELVESLQLDRQARDEVFLQQSQTIKSLLLNVAQQSGASQENIQQLVHFLNGLQLQSITESNQVLQAQFLIPGNKLSLNKDMFIQFESKKQSDDTIDTDYCRIFFVLDLAQLRETMVDMQIQKRIISITIYNDHVLVNNNIDAIQHIMKQNLETLHYQLSAVQWKPLYEKEQSLSHSDAEEVDANQTTKGFDFRI